MKLSAPSALRNRDAILGVLRHCLPAKGTILEIASGSGEHIVHFAENLPHLDWQPSDRDPHQLASINAYVAESKLGNLKPPLVVDTLRNDWHERLNAPLAKFDGMVCINMIHISDWSATIGLMDGAAALLKPGAPLYFYGPYRRRDHPTAPSNAEFDAALRARNAAWGLRELEAVEAAAISCGFGKASVTEMPTNNLSVIFRRA